MLVVADSKESSLRFYKRIAAHFPVRTFLSIYTDATGGKLELDAVEQIKQFKLTANSILVTCQIAYEGLDEPPISHIASLTHIRSTPWIEQMIARAWRRHEGKDVCHVFVPDDPRMNRVIKRIHNEQIDIVRETVERDRSETAGASVPYQGVVGLEGMIDEMRVAELDGTPIESSRSRSTEHRRTPPPGPTA